MNDVKIQISPETLVRLERLMAPGQTYDEAIKKLLDDAGVLSPKKADWKPWELQD